MKKNIFLLGSTGSIGRSTLDIIREHSDKYHTSALVANVNVELLLEQIEEFNPEFVVVYNEQIYAKYKSELDNFNTKVLFGFQGLIEILDTAEIDVFLNAFVGFQGFIPTIEAINRNIDIAIANKETLVVGGELITGLAEKKNVKLLPIDSEHSAIWQCLQGEDIKDVKRIILTASGGPFRNTSIEAMQDISVEQALNHPNWKMGNKITIDSATLMNKGLEVIEAYWLYNVKINQIEVVVHPQSIIHSMVEFEDSSIKAQLGLPDMKIPILYALSHPKRLKLNLESINFAEIKNLTFEKPDFKKFQCLKIAYQAIEQGNTYPAAMNAANEIAVDAFLNKKISFNRIAEIIEEVLNQHKEESADSIDKLLESDKLSREKAISLLN
jgi:1-deoxy-D-xylulose-5-phosphate reductoisomerase